MLKEYCAFVLNKFISIKIQLQIRPINQSSNTDRRNGRQQNRSASQILNNSNSQIKFRLDIIANLLYASIQSFRHQDEERNQNDQRTFKIRKSQINDQKKINDQSQNMDLEIALVPQNPQDPTDCELNAFMKWRFFHRNNINKDR